MVDDWDVLEHEYDLSDEAIKKLEEKAQALELNRLLCNEVPDVCNLLKRQILDCSRALLSCGVSTPPKETDTGYVPLFHPQGHIRGYLMIDKWKIVKADIQLKLPKWRKGQMFQSQISPSRPWPIPQIQNASNFLQLALATLDSLDQLPFEPNKPPYTVHHVNQLLDEVAGHLQRVKDELTSVAYVPMFPSAANHASEVFEPSVPRDLVVDVVLGRGGTELQAVVYGLSGPVQDINHAARRDRELVRPQDDNKPLIGQLYFYRDRWVELLDRAEVSVPVAMVSASLIALNACLEWCRRLRDKTLPQLHGQPNLRFSSPPSRAAALSPTPPLT